MDIVHINGLSEQHSEDLYNTKISMFYHRPRYLFCLNRNIYYGHFCAVSVQPDGQ